MSASVFWVDSCASTQDLAWDAPAPHSPAGSFWLARQQSEGRGRGAGRRWTSPPGGIYVSWRLTLQQPQGLALLGALAVARTAGELGVAVRLKWPNDCQADGRKLAGVLPDCRWRGSECSAVLGIGFNVCVPPEELPEESVSLHQLSPQGAALSAEEVWPRLRAHLESLGELHRARGLSGYLDEARSLSLQPGTAVEYWMGGQRHTDVAEGLDDEGRLLLRSGPALMSVEKLRLLD